MTTSSAIIDHFHAVSLAPCAGGLCSCDVWQARMLHTSSSHVAFLTHCSGIRIDVFPAQYADSRLL